MVEGSFRSMKKRGKLVRRQAGELLAHGFIEFVPSGLVGVRFHERGEPFRQLRGWEYGMGEAFIRDIEPCIQAPVGQFSDREGQHSRGGARPLGFFRKLTSTALVLCSMV